MDPDSDPDPTIFVIDIQGSNKTQFKKKFFCVLLMKLHLHHFSKIKSQKEVTKTVGIKVFSYYFCLIIEGSGPYL